MSKELGAQLDVAEVILKALSRGPLRRTDLENHVVSKGVSISCFRHKFAWLVVDGDIVKVGVEWTAPFMVTAKGKAFLVWRDML